MKRWLPSFESGWELLAFCGSLIVILGVIVECVDLLAKCSKNNWCHKWGKRLIWHSNDRRVLMQFIHGVESINLLIEIIGFVLVVGGLGMELYGGTKALLASDSENRRLQTELKGSIDFAASIRMKMIAPRDLFFDEAKFASDLAGRPKGAVAIYVTSGNRTEERLAIKIKAALTNAGWTVIPSTPIADDFLTKHPEYSMGNILIVKTIPDLMADFRGHPIANQSAPISITNFWRIDTPDRIFRVALGDCGVWAGQMMQNPSLPDGSMELILGVSVQ